MMISRYVFFTTIVCRFAPGYLELAGFLCKQKQHFSPSLASAINGTLACFALWKSVSVIFLWQSNFVFFFHYITMSRLLTIKWHGIVVRTLRSGSGPEKNTNTMIRKYKYNVRTLRSGSGLQKNTNTIIQKYKYNVRTLWSGSGPQHNFQHKNINNFWVGIFISQSDINQVSEKRGWFSEARQG